ncbi:hypothetical protein Pfo_019956 [Paulownia fortunei]|nr:hypothetical protein Pfo_019956 [Paulownia fortunei]
MNFELLKMVAKEKRDIPIRPVLLKFGVALAISLGGILYTFFRTKRIKPPKSKPSQRSPGNGSQADSRGQSGELRDDDRALQDSSLRKVSSQNSISDCSSNGRHSGDRDGFLLPEFNELVKECNMAVIMDDISPRKNGESLVPDVESPREYKCAEHDEHEREIRRLQIEVKILEERERKLEIQLLEYCGIKEQETAVMELRNQLRLNNMETKLYNLKIESLLSHNRRLDAQVADYANVVTELEAAKAKIKLLRKKLKCEAEQNREQILTLQDRVMKLQDQEKKAVEIDQDVEMKLRERKELKEELEEMKKSNQGLKQENSDLAQKLEYVQMLATTALDNEEVLELKEESRLLQQRNDDLTKEIEQLQADRCTDIEELVYLRWINACLRHELRNYQPGPGKTIARDLSKTLSPKSEEKAKQLILEYAHKEVSGEKGLDIADFDSDQWSSSQASCLTDPGEHDDLSVDTSSANKTNHSSKTKVFAKLMRLLRGKGSPRNIQGPTSPLERAVSVDDIAGRYSSDFHSGFSVGVDAGTDDLMKTLRNSSGVHLVDALSISRDLIPEVQRVLQGKAAIVLEEPVMMVPRVYLEQLTR